MCSSDLSIKTNKTPKKILRFNIDIYSQFTLHSCLLLIYTNISLLSFHMTLLEKLWNYVVIYVWNALSCFKNLKKKSQILQSVEMQETQLGRLDAIKARNTTTQSLLPLLSHPKSPSLSPAYSLPYTIIFWWLLFCNNNDNNNNKEGSVI